jgi:predicted regulator of Ras-like GTPase activity (Roadblock/LC7/MglB family)
MEERDDMTIAGERAHSIDDALQGFLRETAALCAVVFDRSGARIAGQGAAGNIDLAAIGSLAAGAYASTEQMARLIGEREFSVLFHQGEHGHLLLTLVDEHHLLLVVFDDRTTVGLVRVAAKEHARQLGAVLRGGLPQVASS